MKDSKAASGPDSGEMSIQQPGQLSEAEFLDQEIRLARRAMQNARAHLKDDARYLADPRVWVERYPVASTVVAGAVGALLGRGIFSKAAKRERLDSEILEMVKEARGRGSPFLHGMGESLRKNLVKMLTSGLVSQAMSAFQSYARPEAEYPGAESREEAEADVGAQI